MKTRMAFGLLLFAVLLGTGQGQEQSHNGFWWVGSSENFKVGFVTGYAMATGNARDAMFFQCLAAKNGGTVPQKYPGDEAFDECFKSPAVSSFVSFHGLRFGQLSEGVDEFYKDFKNKNLEIPLAMHYVSDELNGKSAKELEDELTAWRRSAAK